MYKEHDRLRNVFCLLNRLSSRSLPVDYDSVFYLVITIPILVVVMVASLITAVYFVNKKRLVSVTYLFLSDSRTFVVQTAIVVIVIA